MTNNDKKPVPDPDINRGELYSDEKTQTKIHQHLSDENDQISEEDIENVPTAIPEKTEEDLDQNNSSNKSGNENEPADSKDIEEKKGAKETYPIKTPWDILGS